MNKRKNTFRFLLVTVLSSAVMSCQTVPSEYGYGDPVKPLTTEERVQNAVRSAALEASKGSGDLAQAVTAAETVYRHDPKDPEAAFIYASALRKAGLIEQAQLVLKPFAISPTDANEDVLVEYAKIKLQSGDLKGAELFSQEALVLNPDSADAHNILGVAVDAQGYHQAAENHFRTALKNVAGDVSLRAAISNNLALSLLAQKKYGEAESLLNGAKTPERFDQDIINANQNFVDQLS